MLSLANVIIVSMNMKFKIRTTLQVSQISLKRAIFKTTYALAPGLLGEIFQELAILFGPGEIFYSFSVAKLKSRLRCTKFCFCSISLKKYVARKKRKLNRTLELQLLTLNKLIAKQLAARAF